jgi:DMSO/TMAO reductase YedYZ molybdopterin-dependent catalytic subunit
MRSQRRIGAIIGLLSAAVAVAVAHLIAVLIDESASPITAVGLAVIDLAPPGVKEFAISTFGSNDKLALVIGISVLLAAFAAGMGVLSTRHRWVATVSVAGFGLVGAIAAMTRPSAGTLAPLPSLAGVIIGLVAVRLLFDASRTQGAGALLDPELSPTGFDRRRFVLTGAAFAGIAAAAGVGSRLAGATTRRTVASRAGLKIPAPSDTATLAKGTGVGVRGVSSFYTPNSTFYRVDTALVVPKIDAEDWRLRIHGMVDHEVEMTMSDLLSRPLIERDITLACVSNEVGGRYIGNARWIGAPLKPILEEAGVHDGADQLVSRSADGWTCGTPTAVLMDGRDAMLAVAMNGEPLPLKHGFPVRMVTPGLYGYVSATKWVVDMELTTFDVYDAYWISRGWAQKAPIKTMSRIDTPYTSEVLTAGEVPIAGVAWAQHRGIDGVEVKIDDGPWRRADLARVPTLDTWRQWVYRWNAERGSHTIAVRATDKTGYTQTAKKVQPIPDGATGWHTIDVKVV